MISLLGRSGRDRPAIKEMIVPSLLPVAVGLTLGPQALGGVLLANATGGYGIKEIGEHFGLHYSRVSRIIARARLAKGKT